MYLYVIYIYTQVEYTMIDGLGGRVEKKNKKKNRDEARKRKAFNSIRMLQQHTYIFTCVYVYILTHSQTYTYIHMYRTYKYVYMYTHRRSTQ